MNDSDRIEIIRNLGLTEYEAKCYLSLFRKESLSVSDIVAIAEVPQANVYGTMKKLQARGLCILMPGKIKKFAAADPQLFRQNSLHVIDESRKSVNYLADELETLFKVTRQNNSPLDYIEVLGNNDQIHLKHIELAETAQSEILALSRPPFPYTSSSQELKSQQSQVLGKAVDRGVQLRTIQMIPADEETRNGFFKNVTELYNPAVEEMRLVDSLPMKINIYDEKTTFILLEHPISNQLSLTGLIVNHPDMAKLHKKTFEAYWQEGMDSYMFDGHEYYLDKTRALQSKRKS